MESKPLDSGMPRLGGTASSPSHQKDLQSRCVASRKLCKGMGANHGEGVVGFLCSCGRISCDDALMVHK